MEEKFEKIINKINNLKNFDSYIISHLTNYLIMKFNWEVLYIIINLNMNILLLFIIWFNFTFSSILYYKFCDTFFSYYIYIKNVFLFIRNIYNLDI